ncbi:hypothetical protein BJX61DRAFT_544143 [Aspergillus egyptiacus]|nr:hypothetical protein BJX61DRAFT_544143 [Aspergillus egyptiacus]
MTRVSRRSASVRTRRSPSRVSKRKARKHKVILESVTQAKKKLRSVISFEAKAPPGYTFISAGDPHFTSACKELCRRDGLKVYAVSTTPHLHTHGLSQHVHRIGYHFPSAVVAAVCMDRGLYLTAAGKAVSFYNVSEDANGDKTNSVSQITINTEARDVLKDLFPNIPGNDLNQIIKTAFQKGQRKVGTAVELPLARRAQLAVVAHIRHVYTNYDRLLKSTSFHEARAAVEQPTLAKLVEWRGDDENGKTVLEDVFREVIVISDDEDSDTEGEPQIYHGRDTSVEIISSKPVVEELPMKPASHGHTALRDAHVEISGDEAPPGFRFIRQTPKKAKVDRRGFSRYQAWDRAINRYRNVASGFSHQPPPYSGGEPSQENRGYNKAPSHRPVGPQHSSVAPYSLLNQRAISNNVSRTPLNPVAEHRVSSAPSLHVCLSGGYHMKDNPAVLTLDEPLELYPFAQQPDKRRDALSPLDTGPLERDRLLEQPRPSFAVPDLLNKPVFIGGPRETHDRIGGCPRPPLSTSGHLRISNMDQQDRVLPSIESPLPLEIKRSNCGQIEHLAKRMSGAFAFRSVTPHSQVHKDIPSQPGLQDTAQDHVSRKRRLTYYGPVSLDKAPTPLSTYPVDHYETAGQASVPNQPFVCRRYIDPDEPRLIAQHQPTSLRSSFISTARFEPETQIPEHRRPAKSRPYSPNRLVDFQAVRHSSPGQPRMTPDAKYGIPADKGPARNFQPFWSDASEARTSHCSIGYNPNGVNDSETSKIQRGAAWWSRNTDRAPVFHETAEKQGLYADGFVRPVDVRESGVLENRRHPRSHMVESPPRPANAKCHGDQHWRVPADSLTSVPPHHRIHSGPKTRAPLQYPVTGNRYPTQHDSGLFQTSPPVHQTERRFKGPVTSSRYGDKDNPIPLGT